MQVPDFSDIQDIVQISRAAFFGKSSDHPRSLYQAKLLTQKNLGSACLTFMLIHFLNCFITLLEVTALLKMTALLYTSHCYNDSDWIRGHQETPSEIVSSLEAKPKPVYICCYWLVDWLIYYSNSPAVLGKAVLPNWSTRNTQYIHTAHKTILYNIIITTIKI